MEWFLRQRFEQIEMGSWYIDYVNKEYEERKDYLVESLNLAEEKERIRKNESGEFVLDFGGALQCQEFINRRSELVKALDGVDARLKEHALLEKKQELSSTSSVKMILEMLKKEPKKVMKDPQISPLSSETIKRILERLKD